MQDEFSISPIEPSESQRIQKQEEVEARKLDIVQEASKVAEKQNADQAFNPVLMSRRYKTLEERLGRKVAEKKDVEDADMVHEIEEVETLAHEFHRTNPELDPRSLQLLLSLLKKGDTPEEILRKVMKNYPDPALADESLEFLEKATSRDLAAKIRQARENLHQAHGREVAAGRNIGAEARAFSQQGLGSPTGLRDLYRDITGNPRTATTLFQEMKDKFSYDNMKKAINFLLHCLGADLKAKGPSIAPGQLHALMSEARNLLAILWVYNFFKGRMSLIKKAFERTNMLLPSKITFEMLAKMFVQFLMERYPSMDKVFQLAAQMGISADLMAQIILFTQMRDGVRGVAPKLFRNEQHRHDVLMSFIEALEEIEEQLEEDEEEEKEEEEQDG